MRLPYVYMTTMPCLAHHIFNAFYDTFTCCLPKDTLYTILVLLLWSERMILHQKQESPQVILYNLFL